MVVWVERIWIPAFAGMTKNGMSADDPVADVPTVRFIEAQVTGILLSEFSQSGKVEGK